VGSASESLLRVTHLELCAVENRLWDQGLFGVEFQLPREAGSNRQQRLQSRLDSARAR
jgi:hypothetical protein